MDACFVSLEVRFCWLKQVEKQSYNNYVLLIYLIYFENTAEIIVDKWLDDLKFEGDDVCLHFLFHLADSERLPEKLPLINDVNCFLH